MTVVRPLSADKMTIEPSFFKDLMASLSVGFLCWLQAAATISATGIFEGVTLKFKAFIRSRIDHFLLGNGLKDSSAISIDLF